MEDRSQYEQMIGFHVSKKSGKPFKSTFKVNTVRAITINEDTGHLAFQFNEDDSAVDCHRCQSVQEEFEALARLI